MDGVRLAELHERGSHVSLCADALRTAGIAGDSLAQSLFVPGRIEVLGKHTDYAGGRSLLAACERGFTVVVTPRNDSQVSILDVAKTESVHFRLEPDIEPNAGWANYPMTVARRVARNFPEAVVGADIAFLSDLPQAAGMSSSSAFMVATFLALAAVNDLTLHERYREVVRTSEDLAGYLATIENGEDFGILRGDRGVGTQGGSEDHTAMLCGQPGRLIQYAFAPVRFERGIPLPDGYTFAIGVSGVHAEKTGAARERYNEAAQLTRLAATLWRTATGGSETTIGAVVESDRDAANKLEGILFTARGGDLVPRLLVDRFAHFLAESVEIIPAAGDALARKDLTAFGDLVDRSQRLAEDLLRNQVAETIHLARSARAAGAVAASAFGAGFGGSVWALVRNSEVESFRVQWQQGYLAAFPHRSADAVFFQTGAGAPAARRA